MLECVAGSVDGLSSINVSTLSLSAIASDWDRILTTALDGQGLSVAAHGIIAVNRTIESLIGGGSSAEAAKSALHEALLHQAAFDAQFKALSR
jgi:hypothetical protein